MNYNYNLFYTAVKLFPTIMQASSTISRPGPTVAPCYQLSNFETINEGNGLYFKKCYQITPTIAELHVTRHFSLTKSVINEILETAFATAVFHYRV
jgi:hypothetical protein